MTQQVHINFFLSIGNGEKYENPFSINKSFGFALLHCKPKETISCGHIVSYSKPAVILIYESKLTQTDSVGNVSVTFFVSRKA